MSLKIYPVVLKLVRSLAPRVRPLRARCSALADQMERALISIPLNVAEGAYSRGKGPHQNSLCTEAVYAPDRQGARSGEYCSI